MATEGGGATRAGKRIGLGTKILIGMGLGAAEYRVVFIFETMDAFNSFVTSGWEAGANAMASAKTKTEGGALAGAITVSEGVKMIQLNGEGAIVGVSITAAKYYKDKELN